MPISRTPLNPSHLFESFVVCATNEAAFAAAADAVVNPLCLYGRTGSGKSHLLHAIANELRARRPASDVLLVSASALNHASWGRHYADHAPAVQAELAQADAVLVDDAVPEWFGPETMARIARLLRHAVQHGVRVVVASPFAAPLLDGAAVAEVGYPDEPSRIELAGRIATSLGMTLPPEIVREVASRLSGSPRELQSVLATMAAELAVASETIELEHLAYAATRRYRV